MHRLCPRSVAFTSFKRNEQKKFEERRRKALRRKKKMKKEKKRRKKSTYCVCHLCNVTTHNIEIFKDKVCLSACVRLCVCHFQMNASFDFNRINWVKRVEILPFINTRMHGISQAIYLWALILDSLIFILTVATAVAVDAGIEMLTYTYLYK